MSKLLHSVRLAFQNLMMRKLRSGLTILGIIFGVCSVITMVAVGEGASQQSQERIKHLGSDNVILDSVKPSGDEEVEENNVLKYGVTSLDIERIRDAVPGVKMILPIRVLNEAVNYRGIAKSSQVIGTYHDLQTVKKIDLLKGRFLCEMDEINKLKVCVISRSLANILFSYEDPLSCELKIRGTYFQVVGAVQESGDDGERDSQVNCSVPMSTLKSQFGDLEVKKSAGSFSAEKTEFTQVIVHMHSPEQVLTAESQIKKLLEYSHKVSDYKMTVPLQLLKEAEATKRMFNIVLGSIAAISLVVGGIGIMNIMLATVTERKREIGLRRALGAKKRDIIRQFLVESVLLSLCGGFIGVILGVLLPYGIEHFTDMAVVVSPASVVIAFGVSALTGLVFGIYPAAQSAQLDPIEALRND